MIKVPPDIQSRYDTILSYRLDMAQANIAENFPVPFVMPSHFFFKTPTSSKFGSAAKSDGAIKPSLFHLT